MAASAIPAKFMGQSLSAPPRPMLHLLQDLATVHGNHQLDTCPATTSPLSLINLQVRVRGQNVLQSTLQYNYEHFLAQVNITEQLTSSDFGVSTGLMNQGYWKNSKVVFSKCRTW